MSIEDRFIPPIETSHCLCLLRHPSMCTSILLHQDPATPASYYTRILLHRHPTTPASCYTRILLHQDLTTPASYYTRILLHQELTTPGSYYTSILLSYGLVLKTLFVSETTKILNSLNIDHKIDSNIIR